MLWLLVSCCIVVLRAVYTRILSSEVPTGVYILRNEVPSVLYVVSVVAACVVLYCGCKCCVAVVPGVVYVLYVLSEIPSVVHIVVVVL